MLFLLSLSLWRTIAAGDELTYPHDRDSANCTPGESLLQLKQERIPARAHSNLLQSCDPGPGSEDISPPDLTHYVRGDSGLHEVVGADGVLMISLKKDVHRFHFSKEHIAVAGIHPSKLLATDGTCATEAALSKGCVSSDVRNSKEWCANLEKTGTGCNTRAEQAIADSHRRAIVAASEREFDWTLIMEDDALLVRPHRWDSAFRKAWEKVPEDTEIIRLSWCLPGNASTIIQPAFADASDFKLIKWSGYSTGYRAGGCTSAYMVHRNAIPQMLSLFPCCCAVDCCLENDLYNRVQKGEHTTRGMTMMLSMDTWGSEEYISEREASSWGVQYGVMMQARSDLASTRTG
jgi:hypothetical protein